jgi:hypothetical protein
MRLLRGNAILWIAVLMVSMVLSCAKDFQDDIDGLNAKYADIDKRLTNIESQVSKMNQDLSRLSVLATAVEQGFYVTEVKTTAEGYELTLSNGRVIVLQNGPDNSLTPAPGISMVQIGDQHYWTMNGMLLTGSDGLPIPATGGTPQVKYDKASNQWLLSVDGGVTFQIINIYASVVINDNVLMQVINNYISQHSTTFISQEVLYQIITAYIQQNYAQIFDVNILNQVIVSYVEQHYTQIFNYELLSSIFNEYNFQYTAQHLDVDVVTNILVSFINEHKEVFINNEVIYAILNSYVEVNKVDIFNQELIVEVVNNYISNNTNFVSVALLQQIVASYIEQHQDVIINNEMIQQILIEYVQKNYQQIFSQEIIAQLINQYVIDNKTTIFNETIISEVINNFVQNNYNTLISNETIYELINNYIELNKTTIISETVLYEVISNYFQKNYNVIIDETFINQIITAYISEHKTTIIDIDIVRQVVVSYVKTYYAQIFDYDFLTQIITAYFEKNQTIINQYVSQYTGVIKDIMVDGSLCVVTLNNNSTIQLAVYDAYARIRDRVQSIVLVPNANGHISHYNNYDDVTLTYLVTPAQMANVIATNANNKIGVDCVVLDGKGNRATYHADKVSGDNDGKLNVTILWLKTYKEQSKLMALHVYDNIEGGTDYITSFTPIDWLDY